MSSQVSAKASLATTTTEEGRDKSCLSLQIIRKKMKFSKIRTELYAWFPWRESFVMVPMLSMLFNVILAAFLSQITSPDNPELLGQGLVMIGLVSGASISIVTLTFSLTVLSIQIAAQSYSPRLLDDFLKDPVSKVVISVNLGSYAYCFTMTYFIQDEMYNPEVPHVAIHFLTVHIGLVLITFVNFIHFFINGFRIEKILNRAGDSSLRAARALSLAFDTDLKRDEQPEVPSFAYKVGATRSGYVTHFMLERIVGMAEKLDVCVRYRHQIGEFVNEGTTLCHIWDLKTRETDLDVKLGDRVFEYILYEEESWKDLNRVKQVERKLGVFASEGVIMSKKRSSDLDVTLGLQQLSDIAMRALSPGINDPTSAIQCMDVLSSLLSTLALMNLGIPNGRDEADNIRACAPRRSFSYLVSMLDSIRRYGGSDLGVCRRGLRLFGDLGAILTRAGRTERIPVVLTQLEQWLVTCKANFASGTPELESLQELYEFVLRGIEDSDHVKVKHNEDVGKDTQDLDMTHNEPETDSERAVAEAAPTKLVGLATSVLGFGSSEKKEG